MLMHHSDPALDRISGRSEANGLSMHAYHTTVRGRHSIGNSHQGRLPRSVLAQHRVDCSTANAKARIAQGSNCVKPLVDMFQRECRRILGHKPVGAAMKVDGIRNVDVRCSASALTPSVSVA